MSSPPVALTIAGSDSCAGAGLQADLLAFAACGVHGLTVATAVVAERPGAVLGLHAVPPEIIDLQLAAVLPAYPVRGIKTGLLPTAAAISVVRAWLTRHPVPLVVDPVGIASTGTPLAAADAAGPLLDLVRHHATVATPNRAEAASWLGAPLPDHPEAARDTAARLRDRIGVAVLLKGGHFCGPESVDWLADTAGEVAVAGPRIPGLDVHGTGCAYSAAIAAGLARGFPLREAVRRARDHLHRALAGHREWTGPDGERRKALAQDPEP
jgi:hydroxymethylpyrimidine/phosphomethylpyrimidine kinase